jgi:DNA mismatch repair ATPase MutS
MAAAKAVLAALARRSQVLASTHDSELQVLLA